MSNCRRIGYSPIFACSTIEEYHTKGKPREVTELFTTIDKFCRDLDPPAIKKEYRKLYIRYLHNKTGFCSVRVQKSSLRIWLKLKYSRLENPPNYVRDVSNIGHWGVGDVELAIDSLEKLPAAKSLIRQSFEENR